MRLETTGKIYVILALIVAAVFSPLAYSWVTVILLAGYIFQIRWPVSAAIGLLSVYFLYFVIPVLYGQFIPAFLAPLVSLPLLYLISLEMQKTAPDISINSIKRARWFSRLALFLLVVSLAVLAVALFIMNLTLVLSCIILLVAYLGLVLYIYRHFPQKPVSAEIATRRILAGKEENFSTLLNIRTGVGGVLRLQPLSDWIKVHDPLISLKAKQTLIEGKITPPLSGAGEVKLQGTAIDRWGLLQVRFEIEPLKLLVIPRARYAAWLAQKYLAGTSMGALPLLSNLNSLKAAQGLRQGIEFYGNRQYQAGDSLKNIDWKHSVKYDELIVKEFTEFHGRPAIMLINLTAADLEEADKLAYNIIITAMTLGRENIPAAMAVYDHAKVILNTPPLAAAELLKNALQLIDKIEIIPSPVKYLAPPDLLRLRSNASRLNQSQEHPAQVLAELLRWEYKSISEHARLNPSYQALATTTAKLTEQATVVTLSFRNHDAEALAFNNYVLAQKGDQVINI